MIKLIKTIQDYFKDREELLNKTEKVSFMEDFLDRHEFYLTHYSSAPSVITLGSYRRDHILIKLDHDDIVYLYEKYVKNLNQEKLDRIQKIKEEYESVDNIN